VQVALVEEAGALGDLGRREAAFEQVAGEADALREREAVRRQSVGGAEQAGQAVAADAGFVGQLREREVGGEVVVEQLAGSAQRGVAPRGAEPASCSTTT